MKKLLTVSAAAVTVAAALCGCGKSASTNTPRTIPDTDVPTQSQTDRTRDAQTDTDREQIDNSIPDVQDRRRNNGISDFVNRHFFSRFGTYTVEYIHAPYGIDKDETLDYTLTLNPDNTFEMTVVSSGVTAEHNGRWYERRHELIMYYDDEITDIPHNVYVADSMYADLLPHGKIMIYDNCHTIVLAKQYESDTQTESKARIRS